MNEEKDSHRVGRAGRWKETDNDENTHMFSNNINNHIHFHHPMHHRCIVMLRALCGIKITSASRINIFCTVKRN